MIDQLSGDSLYNTFYYDDLAVRLATSQLFDYLVNAWD